MSWIMWYKLKGLDGGATKADRASASVGPSVATPLPRSFWDSTLSILIPFK